MKKIELNIKMKLSSPFHFGGGKGNIDSCSYIQRDMNGMPYWSGGALKGLVRSNAMMLYEAKTGYMCAFTHQNVDEAAKCGCIVCEMMGSSGNSRGSLYFQDLMMNEEQDIEIEHRTGNAIDRYRGTAKDSHLFMVEAVNAVDKLELSGKISGYLSEENYEEQVELLIKAIEFIRFAGGNTSRGLGWVEKISVDQVKNENPVVENTLKSSKAVKVKLTIKSPLLIGKHSSQSNFKDTQKVIPGSVVRACMAQEIVRRCGIKDPKGRINFVTEPNPSEEGTAFYHLRKEFTNIRIRAFQPMGGHPVPLSAVQCKYSDREECKYKLYDTLAYRLCKVPDGNYSCPVCGERLERASGSYNIIDHTVSQISPQTMTVTRNAINRYRRNSQDGMLYSLNLLTPYVETTHIENNIAGKKTEELYFTGEITGNIEVNEIRELLGSQIHIGGFQTSGYGRAAVTIEPLNVPDKTDIIDKIREHIENFNNVIRHMEKEKDGEQLLYVPITTQTDAIVELPRQLSGRKENKEYISAYESLFTNCVKSGAKLHTVMAQHDSWRGFDTSQQEKYLKDAVHMIRAGAVFVLCITELTDDFLEALWHLQQNGICSKDKPKLYSQNGYGQITVADEFHSNFALGKDNDCIMK